MSDSQHTPGPWKAGDGSWVTASHPVPEISGTDHVEYYGGHLIAESIAPQNMNLIAAAPELLEALQMLMPQAPSRGMCDEYDRAMWDNAASAIAKATGKESA